MTLWVESLGGDPKLGVLQVRDGRFSCVIGLDELDKALKDAGLAIGEMKGET